MYPCQKPGGGKGRRDGMSGIIGIVCGSHLSAEPSALWKGLSAMAHRGSGAAQILFFDPASGASRLLHDNASPEEFSPTRMIAAIGACGRNPPLASADGRFVLALDGRIYNAPELLAESRSRSLPPDSDQDAQALLAAFGRWGSACLPRLVGMFAFAVLDCKMRRFFLARDCFGIKPLYYSLVGGFTFASQVGGLLEFAGASRRANPQRVYEFLDQGRTDSGNETLFSDIRQLPPGHFLEVPLDQHARPESSPYWRLSLKPGAALSFDQAAEKLRESLLGSVRLHLRDCGTAGSALSGGIDSSAIVGAMRAIAQDAPLHTFTFVAGSAEQRFEWDEEPWADMVGRATGAIMHKVRISPQALARDFDRVVYLQDWPFGSPVIFAQLEVFRAAREAGISTLLSGQGADVLFASNPGLWIASLMRRGRLHQAVRFIRGTSAAGNVGARQLVLAALVHNMGAPARTLARRLLRRPADLIQTSWFRERRVSFGGSQKIRGPSLVRSAMSDLLTGMLPGALRFEDRNAAASGIENRTPFLTPAIAEFAFSLPEELLVAPDGAPKALLRSAMRGLVPEPVIARRDRMGFPVPAQQWLSELAPWVDGMLQEAAVPVLDHTRIRHAWADFRSARDCSWPASLLIWRCLSFIGWARRFGVVFD